MFQVTRKLLGSLRFRENRTKQIQKKERAILESLHRVVLPAICQPGELLTAQIVLPELVEKASLLLTCLILLT